MPRAGPDHPAEAGELEKAAVFSAALRCDSAENSDGDSDLEVGAVPHLKKH